MLRKSYTRSLQRDVEQLISLVKPVTDESFTYAQLDGLPPPVQRYFRRALPEGHFYISTVRLKHNGRFKTAPDKNWVAIEGEQYFTTEPPGFIWQGTTRLFTARDQYVAQRGRLVVRLLSLFKVVDAHGPTVDQGELLRWLGESVWFPTNLLPSQRLRWASVDDHSARLMFDHEGLIVNYMVYFSDQDEIIRMETERYMTPERLETWVGEFSDYQRIHGVLIPTAISATWKLPEGDHTYVDFYVKEIRYTLN